LTAAGGSGARIAAGRVGRPHGLDGSFYVTRPRARLLAAGSTVTVAGRQRALVRRAGTDQRPIVRLEGVDDRDAALQLRGLELEVDAAQAPALEDGEYWAHELEGCSVTASDRQLGTVSRLLELPSCEALEVDVGTGEPLLVPMVKDAIAGISISERRIEVNPEFLDLAADATRSSGDGG
jgi:16S rRNA processing protein RimM